MGEHKEARYIEGHGKSGPGKSGDYCNYRLILKYYYNKSSIPIMYYSTLVVVLCPESDMSE